MAKGDSPAKPGKVFSEGVVAALLMAKGDTTISKKNYEIMSALDGNKTPSGLEHDFRSVIAKAKELKKRVENGEVFEPVAPGSKRGASTKTTPAKPTVKATPASSTKRKEQHSVGDDTPTKKPKGTNNAGSNNGMMGSEDGAVKSPFIKPDPDAAADEDEDDTDLY